MTVKRQKILLALTEQSQRERLRYHLEAEHYMVLEAEDHKSMDEALKDFSVDLLLLELSDTNQHSLDLLSNMRSNYPMAVLPIIAVVNLEQDQDIINLLKSGASDYLAQPIHVELLLARVKAQLGFHLIAKEVRDKYGDLQINALCEGLWVWDYQTNNMYVSSRVETLLGSSQGELNTHENLWETRMCPEDYALFKKSVDDHIRAKGLPVLCNCRLRQENGQEFWVLMSAVAVRSENNQLQALAGTIINIDQTTCTDHLTGLPNRLQLEAELQWACQLAQRDFNYQFGVMLIKITTFDSMVNALGNVVGDELIIQFSKRLANCIRKQNRACYMGRGEFCVLVNSIKNIHDVLVVVQRVQGNVSQSYNLYSKEVHLSVKYGICINDLECKLNADHLMADLNTALAIAMESSDSIYAFHDPEMNARMHGIDNLEKRLREAIEKQNIEVHYQPIISLENKKIVSFEALLRWRKPTTGYYSPQEFLPIAEETGLIHMLGHIVLQEVCRQLSDWQTKNLLSENFRVNINVSPSQLRDPHYLKEVESTLDRYSVSGKHIIFEVKENCAMDESHAKNELFEQFHGLGIQISIDGFGAGHSSLPYLFALPIDQLKISRQFTEHMDRNSTHMRIVKTIRNLADNLDVALVVEGVENQETEDLLKEINCDCAQGYFYSKPLNGRMAEDFIAHQKH